MHELCVEPEQKILQALQDLRTWAEDPRDARVHHLVITGKIHQSQVDPQHLQAWGFEFVKGTKRSNLAYYHKTLAYPWGKVDLMLHLNGTWSCQVTPNVPQKDLSVISEYVNAAIKTMTAGYEPFHVVVKRYEASRVESGPVLLWLKSQNIREIKVYIHDNYEARAEITYLDPAYGPPVERILSNF